MKWSDLPVNPSERMLRQFAGLWIVFFAGTAAWRWFGLHEPRAAEVFAVLAFTIGPAGLIAPALLRPIFIGWLALAFPIGWLVSKVVVAVLFALVITPVALIFKSRGRDPLHLRRPAGGSLWAAKPAPRDLPSYFRQY